MKVPTVHNSAKEGEIAQTILLPGDPLRAKFIAENYLDNPVNYSQVRGMLGYTGTYKGQRVSVQGSGMGAPSMAIYAHELIHGYGVKRLIRVGSAGGLHPSLKVGDLIGASAASYDSNFNQQLNIRGTITPAASFNLLKKAHQIAGTKGIPLKVGVVLSSDLFYTPEGTKALEGWQDLGILAVEMEAATLYLEAQMGNVEALALLTVSDLPFTGEKMSAQEREQTLSEMIELALEVAIS
ncbi:MAG: purine-nucleoside phosphorylase [Sphaerochaetaceae bacterium]|jgi:purine-nucleoside phosphorylase